MHQISMVSAPVPAAPMLSDLFSNEDAKSIEQQLVELSPVDRAMRSIERVLKDGLTAVVAFSSGKDSSVTANLTLNAAINVIREGFTCPPVVISHSDTMVESPVVRALADGELAKMKAFADRHGIPIEVRVGRPSLSACFATRIIGARALPPFPQLGVRDCSTSWKALVNQRTIRKVTARDAKVVTLIGTRRDESQARAVNTAARGETADEPWANSDGDLMLSPILHWSSDEIWTYIGEASAGLHLSYSDFAEVMDFYRDAGASSCVVVADMKSAATNKACGARGGCWTCTAVQNDRSVENMLEQNPGKYPYLVPLLRLRDYLAGSQWDWSLRNFIGRTISPEGRIKVQADQYSPKMVEDLLYYILAAQDEANRLGAPAPVRAVGLRELIAIDFWWSARAIHPPFHALAIYFDHCAGNVRFAPKIERPCRPSPTPVIGEIYVGKDWDDDTSALYPNGLRYVEWELHSDSCGPGLRSNKAGKVFLDLEEAPELDVDEQSAADFLEFIAPEKIEQYHRKDCRDWTLGALIYLQYGTVSIGTGQSSMVDSIMRRSQWLQHHGLHGHQTAEALRPRCCDLAEQQAELFT